MVSFLKILFGITWHLIVQLKEAVSNKGIEVYLVILIVIQLIDLFNKLMISSYECPFLHAQQLNLFISSGPPGGRGEMPSGLTIFRDQVNFSKE